MYSLPTTGMKTKDKNVSLSQTYSQYLPLVYSIGIVSLSGALKLTFAYAFLDMVIPLNQFIVAALVTYAAYAFDRGIENKEDENRSIFFKKILIYTAILSLLISFILFPNPVLAIPFLIAYLYTKGIRGYRLKGGCGGKNTIVAFTFALGMVILMGIYSIPALMIYFFFFCKSFVNTILYDVRDVEKDRAAGIATIPTILKTFELKTFLLTISFLAHIVLISGYILGMVTGIDVILLSTIHGTFYILRYSGNYAVLRNTLVDGEWILYTLYTILRDCAL
jgi:4-hydroxybenzoate polyprenyltransferase